MNELEYIRMIHSYGKFYPLNSPLHLELAFAIEEPQNSACFVFRTSSHHCCQNRSLHQNPIKIKCEATLLHHQILTIFSILINSYSITIQN